MKTLLICFVSFVVPFLIDSASFAMQGQTAFCRSDPALPDSSVDRSSRVSAIRESISHKKYDEALHLAENLVKAEGSNYEGYFWKGYIQKQRQELYSAVQSLRNAERLKPVGGAVAKVLALCYDLLDQHQLFVRKMQEAASLDPHDFAPHYYLGRNAASSFKCEDASSHFHAALQRNPADYFSYYELGYCLESNGVLEEARHNYQLSIEQAEQCHVQFSPPFSGLSRIALLENDPIRALSQALQSVQLQPNSAANRMLLAQVFMKGGRHSEAIPQLKKAISLDETASSLYYLLYQCYLKTGETTLAQGTLAEFKKVLSFYGEGHP
jgi:tetratricopeptide (TPR) repeat protein